MVPTRRQRKEVSYNMAQYYRDALKPTTQARPSKTQRKATPVKSTRRKATSNTTTSSEMAPSKRNKTLSEALDSALSCHFSPDSTVTLLVGPNEQKMIAYGSQLTQDSHFFAAALKKEWTEGQTRTIKLPEECPATMAHYLAYSYGGKLFTEDIKSGSLRKDESHIETCFQMLVSLYVCGEHFLNHRIQQSVVKEILRISLSRGEGGYWYPTREEVNIMYRGTPEGSPGRRLMVDLQVLMGAKDELTHDLEVAFIIDVAKALHDKLKEVDCEDAVEALPIAEDYF